MATGEEIAEAGFKYLGTPYSVMDCQAFVEKCLADCGIHKNLAGSNAWYRYIMQNGWIGTPEDSFLSGPFFLSGKLTGRSRRSTNRMGLETPAISVSIPVPAWARSTHLQRVAVSVKAISRASPLAEDGTG